MSLGTNQQFYKDAQQIYETDTGDQTLSMGTPTGLFTGIKWEYDKLTPTPKTFRITQNGAEWTDGTNTYTTALDRLGAVQQALSAVELPPNATTLKLNDTILLDDGSGGATTTLDNTSLTITDDSAGNESKFDTLITPSTAEFDLKTDNNTYAIRGWVSKDDEEAYINVKNDFNGYNATLNGDSLIIADTNNNTSTQYKGDKIKYTDNTTFQILGEDTYFGGSISLFGDSADPATSTANINAETTSISGSTLNTPNITNIGGGAGGVLTWTGSTFDVNGNGNNVNINSSAYLTMNVDNTGGEIRLNGTDLISGSASGSSGDHLVLVINGTTYKIALFTA